MTDSEEHQRRISDTHEWHVIQAWPLITSAVLTLIALGGFASAFHFFQSHQATQDKIIESIQRTQTKTQVDDAAILTRLVTLQEVTNNRIYSLEQWRNTGFWYEPTEGHVASPMRKHH